MHIILSINTPFHGSFLIMGRLFHTYYLYQTGKEHPNETTASNISNISSEKGKNKDTKND